MLRRSLRTRITTRVLVLSATVAVLLGATLVVLIVVRLTLMTTRFRRGRWLVTGWA